MHIGYARVSTEDQNLDIQLQALTQAGCKRIFQEKLSGSTRNRPELTRMLDQLREDDTITVTKLDRLARSTRDLLDIAEIIKQTGAGLKSLSEPWADTTSPAGKMVLTIFSGIAEFEKSLILERTSTMCQLPPLCVISVPLLLTPLLPPGYPAGPVRKPLPHP